MNKIPAKPSRFNPDDLCRFPLDVPTRRHERAILQALLFYFNPCLRPVFERGRLVAITGTRRAYLGLVSMVEGQAPEARDAQ